MTPERKARLLATLNRRQPDLTLVITSYSIHYTKLYETSNGRSISTGPGRPERISAQMHPIIRLFTPIFFVMVFRTFEDISYGLVMSGSRVVEEFDVSYNFV